MIALRECNIDDIQYGEIYAVVMDTIRTVRILRRSDTDGMVRFVALNTADYDNQEFPLSRITRLYAVVASIRKFF